MWAPATAGNSGHGAEVVVTRALCARQSTICGRAYTSPTCISGMSTTHESDSLGIKGIKQVESTAGPPRNRDRTGKQRGEGFRRETMGL